MMMIRRAIFDMWFYNFRIFINRNIYITSNGNIEGNLTDLILK